MGKHRRSNSRRYKEAVEKEDDNAYSLLPDTKSTFSYCCICYRYLLDLCLVLAMAPFVINCFLEAIIYLIKFDYQSVTWGKGIWAFIVVSLWISIAVFGVFCCLAVVRKGVFTRRIRQRKKDNLLSQNESAQGDADSILWIEVTRTNRGKLWLQVAAGLQILRIPTISDFYGTKQKKQSKCCVRDTSSRVIWDRLDGENRLLGFSLPVDEKRQYNSYMIHRFIKNYSFHIEFAS